MCKKQVFHDLVHLKVISTASAIQNKENVIKKRVCETKSAYAFSLSIFKSFIECGCTEIKIQVHLFC